MTRCLGVCSNNVRVNVVLANLDDDLDEDEENQVDDSEMLSKWGKSKGAFYNNGYEKHKDVEAEECMLFLFYDSPVS